MSANVAVIYYSMTGITHRLADAVAAGAAEAGATTRLLRVPELAAPEVVAAMPAWQAHAEATAHVPEATADDVVWADGLAFGTPTRFGNPASQLRQFVDTLGRLWVNGELIDKACTSFTSAKTHHGGLESTILALNNIFYHWGAVIVPLGYTDPLTIWETGNPYGASWVSGQDDALPDEAALAAARTQGRRLARWAAARPASAAARGDIRAEPA